MHNKGCTARWWAFNCRYPSGDTVQRHPDGSYLHIDPKGRKDGRSANGDKGANTIPTLSSRVPKDLSEKWIGSIQDDISPEQYVYLFF